MRLTLFILLIIITVILLLILIAVFTKLKVKINYYYTNVDHTMQVEFKAFFGLIKYRINVPLNKNDLSEKEKNEPSFENEDKDGNQNEKQFSAESLLKRIKGTENFVKNIASLYYIVREFLKKVRITQLEWNSILGTGDAALTGMALGAVWAAKGSLIGMISHYFQLNVVPLISVQPQFQYTITRTSFQCMLQFRIGHAIVAGIKLIKFWKGNRPHLASKPLSNLTQESSKTV